MSGHYGSGGRRRGEDTEAKAPVSSLMDSFSRTLCRTLMGRGEFPSCWWLMSETDVICESHCACNGDRQGWGFKEGGVERREKVHLTSRRGSWAPDVHLWLGTAKLKQGPGRVEAFRDLGFPQIHSCGSATGNRRCEGGTASGMVCTY